MATITLEEGQTLEVDYLVENPGGETADTDAILYIDGTQEDADVGLSIPAGGNTTGLLSWATVEGDAATGYSVTVETNNSMDSITADVVTAPGSTTPDSVVHRYTFEDAGDTTTLTDVAGGVDGSISGMSYAQNGQPEGNYFGSFDGSATVTGCGGSEGSTAWSWSAFVNRNNASTRDDFATGRGSTADAIIRANPDTLEVGRPGDDNYTSSLSVPGNQWVKIGFAYDGNTSGLLYVDGNSEPVTGSSFGDLTSVDLGVNSLSGGMDVADTHDQELTESEFDNL